MCEGGFEAIVAEERGMNNIVTSRTPMKCRSGCIAVIELKGTIRYWDRKYPDRVFLHPHMGGMDSYEDVRGQLA